MRRMAPASTRRRSRASVADGLRLRRTPSQVQGSAPSGRRAAVSWISRSAKRASDGEMQADMIGLLFGQVEHGQARALLDAFNDARDLALRRTGQYEPHVPGVVTQVVVRDLG